MNVHDDGNVLEIVGMCSSHGTHVASIAAGNHKSSGAEELDGVAPGAKIVSLTIGDGRLGSVVKVEVSIEHTIELKTFPFEIGQWKQVQPLLEPSWKSWNYAMLENAFIWLTWATVNLLIGPRQGNLSHVKTFYDMSCFDIFNE